MAVVTLGASGWETVERARLEGSAQRAAPTVS